MSIILQAHPTIHNLMDLLKSMHRLWRIYSTRQKKRVKICSNALWSTTIHLLVAACSHQCKSCRAGVQDLTYPCLMQLDSSLVYNLNSLMNIYLHMTYILVKRSCIKMLQASSGIPPLLLAYVCSHKVTILPPASHLPSQPSHSSVTPG